VELAQNAGLHSALVLSGYGRGEWEYQRELWKLEPELVAENLLEVARTVIEQDRARTTA
jgi:D-glycero-D-manno-heptose 1,7-bisphosphate phosphatase